MSTCGHTEIFANGRCRSCHRDYQLKYQKRRKLAMALLHAAEARGLSGGEAIAVLQHADYRTLQECWNQGIK